MPESGWWNVQPRAATPAEVGAACPHCRRPVGLGDVVKQCPECRVVLHEACYEDTEGGRAFATAGCEQCRLRTYWR